MRFGASGSKTVDDAKRFGFPWTHVLAAGDTQHPSSLAAAAHLCRSTQRTQRRPPWLSLTLLMAAKVGQQRSDSLLQHTSLAVQMPVPWKMGAKMWGSIRHSCPCCAAGKRWLNVATAAGAADQQPIDGSPDCSVLR